MKTDRENRHDGNEKSTGKEDGNKGTREEVHKEVGVSAGHPSKANETGPLPYQSGPVLRLHSRYGAAAVCGAPFGVDRYPDTRFFSITFTTSSNSTGSLPE